MPDTPPRYRFNRVDSDSDQEGGADENGVLSSNVKPNLRSLSLSRRRDCARHAGASEPTQAACLSPACIAGLTSPYCATSRSFQTRSQAVSTVGGILYPNAATTCAAAAAAATAAGLGSAPQRLSSLAQPRFDRSSSFEPVCTPLNGARHVQSCAPQSGLHSAYLLQARVPTPSVAPQMASTCTDGHSQLRSLTPSTRQISFQGEILAPGRSGSQLPPMSRTAQRSCTPPARFCTPPPRSCTPPPQPRSCTPPPRSCTPPPRFCTPPPNYRPCLISSQTAALSLGFQPNNGIVQHYTPATHSACYGPIDVLQSSSGHHPWTGNVQQNQSTSITCGAGSFRTTPRRVVSADVSGQKQFSAQAAQPLSGSYSNIAAAGAFCTTPCRVVSGDASAHKQFNSQATQSLSGRNSSPARPQAIIRSIQPERTVTSPEASRGRALYNARQVPPLAMDTAMHYIEPISSSGQRHEVGPGMHAERLESCTSQSKASCGDGFQYAPESALSSCRTHDAIQLNTPLAALGGNMQCSLVSPRQGACAFQASSMLNLPHPRSRSISPCAARRESLLLQSGTSQLPCQKLTSTSSIPVGSGPVGKPRVLITGASGLLGREVVKAFEMAWEVRGLCMRGSRKHSRHQGLVQCDLTIQDAPVRQVEAFQPHVVIHLASEWRPEALRRNPARARRLNVDVPGELAAACKHFGSWLIFVSADCVFDGTCSPYCESSIPNPLSEFGWHKLHAEKLVLSASPRAAVLRVPVLYGPLESIFDSAVTSLYADLKNGVREVDSWQWCYPTWTCDVAGVLRRMADSHFAGHTIEGIYHWQGKERYTWYEMLLIVAEVTGIDASGATAVHAEPPVPMPRDCHLECTRLQEILGSQNLFQTPLRVGLRICLGKFCQTRSNGHEILDLSTQLKDVPEFELGPGVGITPRGPQLCRASNGASPDLIATVRSDTSRMTNMANEQSV